VADVAQALLNDSVATLRSAVVRVHLQGNARMAANGFICQGGLVLTYPIVGKDEVFELRWEPDGEPAQATCLVVDEAHFLAVGRLRPGRELPFLALRETPVRPHQTHVRVAQWSEERFIVRAGMVVSTDATQDTMVMPGKLRETSQALSLRVLSEPGSAGAPVFDEEGRVAGVVFAGEPGQENSLATPASAIKAVLAKARALMPA
jgi:S1-C subfamily serine protease